MSARIVLYGLLAVVAVAAAVLSFSALRDLALRCGFTPQLAWLLPVVVDAGAAAGSLVWLGGSSAAQSARTFARALAMGLLGLSVAANALGHALAAFALAPAWWVVVIVSAIAPAVLGAVVHLAVLVGRPDTDAADSEPDVTVGLADDTDVVGPQAAAPDHIEADVERATVAQLVAVHPDPDHEPDHDTEPGADTDRAMELIAAGAGRRRLARELGVSEYEARKLLDAHELTATAAAR